SLNNKLGLGTEGTRDEAKRLLENEFPKTWRRALEKEKGLEELLWMLSILHHILSWSRMDRPSHLQEPLPVFRCNKWMQATSTVSLSKLKLSVTSLICLRHKKIRFSSYRQWCSTRQRRKVVPTLSHLTPQTRCATTTDTSYPFPVSSDDYGQYGFAPCPKETMYR